MSEKGRITQEEVNKACEEMTAQGATINTVSMRLHLGKRGGYTTIGNMLKIWAKAKDKEDIPPIPADVEKAALDLAEEIWKFAWKIHADDIKSMRATHRGEITTKDEEIKSLLEGMDEAESKILLEMEQASELKATLSELRQELAKTTGALEVYKNELAELKSVKAKEENSKPESPPTESEEKLVTLHIHSNEATNQKSIRNKQKRNTTEKTIPSMRLNMAPHQEPCEQTIPLPAFA